ncbi:MAG: arginine--tRNA ligase [Candidatus Moranbacteria bacterium]|nr:arginine--tRNA ligase [Candidatus Moranbacteria bacterium]
MKDFILKRLKNYKKNIKFDVFYPKEKNFGDYSTNIALVLAKKESRNPKEIALEIIDFLKNDKKFKNYFDMEIAGAGFINFFFKDKVFIKRLNDFRKNNFKIDKLDLFKDKKYLIEFPDQNPFKSFHIGHLRTAIIGESLSRVLEFCCASVIRTNYQGDVGLHIAKFFYGLQKKKKQNPDIEKKLKTIDQKMDFMADCYVIGANAYKENKKAKEEINQINKKIYQMHSDIKKEWLEKRKWSLDKFDQIYERLNTGFDKFYFESQMAQAALKICNKAYKKGILKKDDQCLIFDGEKYGLNKRVFVNKQGLPTYEGKELALAYKEFSDFGKIDKAIHVVGREQENFFKITFLVEKMLDEELFDDKQYHLSYGMVSVKDIKMSSRLGNVVLGETVMDKAKEEIIKIISLREQGMAVGIKNEIAEKLALAAVKYSFLKINSRKDMVFDLKESVKVEGQSGPYIMYSYVRALNILKKTSSKELKEVMEIKFLKQEKNLLKQLLKFNEIVKKAAQDYQISDICQYCYDLATAFSNFYDKVPVNSEKDAKLKNARILMVKLYAQIIKKNFYLLGIKTVDRM